MILHLVSFRWVESVTEEDVAAFSSALNDMATAIPSLRSYVHGENLHLRPGGADYAAAALVDDAAGLDSYLDHAAHKDVYDMFLGWMIAERSAAQLPIADGTLTLADQ